jgi:peptidoglycan/xylan/chitin deacetylase (PgdA/CDA1 family)
MKNAIKHLVTHYFPCSYACAEILGKSDLRIVVYHDIASGNNAFTDYVSVTTATETFESHLDYYAKNYDVLDLKTVLSGNYSSRRPLLITFDDAYRSVLDNAAPLLRARAMPAALFINTSVVAGRDILLENLLSCLMQNTTIREIAAAIEGPDARSSNLHQMMMETIAHLPLARRQSLPSFLCSAFKLDAGIVEQIKALYLQPRELPTLEGAGIAIGSHGGHHWHFRSFSPEEALSDARESKAELESWLKHPVTAFSFPYGRREDATPHAIAALHEAGYDAIFLAEGQTNPSKTRGLWNRTVLSTEQGRALFIAMEVSPRLRHQKLPMHLETSRVGAPVRELAHG